MATSEIEIQGGSVQSVTLAGQRFVIVPEGEYRRLREAAEASAGIAPGRRPRLLPGGGDDAGAAGPGHSPAAAGPGTLASRVVRCRHPAGDA